MKRFLIATLLLTACGTGQQEISTLDAASTQDNAIYNFHEVDPGLYRSGELTTKSIKVLAEKYKIKTIINLEANPASSEIKAAEKLKINWLWYPITPIGKLDTQQVLSVTDQLKTMPRPILFHCYRGSERTGIVAIAYRLEQGWNYTKAFDEADKYGFSSIFKHWKRDILIILRPQIP